MTTLLCDKQICPEILKKSYEILSKTTYQATGNRLSHITAWIQYSNDPDLSYKFLLANINCQRFYPFIDLIPNLNNIIHVYISLHYFYIYLIIYNFMR